jgi:hypothetical protein
MWLSKVYHHHHDAMVFCGRWKTAQTATEKMYYIPDDIFLHIVSVLLFQHIYNGQDEEILRDVEEGLFSHIYSTA